MGILNGKLAMQNTDAKAREKLVSEISKICNRKTRPIGYQKTYEYHLPECIPDSREASKYVMEYLKFVKNQIKCASKKNITVLDGNKVGIYTYKIDCENLNLGSVKIVEYILPSVKIPLN